MKKTLLSLFCLSMFGASAFAVAPAGMLNGGRGDNLRARNSVDFFRNEKESANKLTRKAPLKASSELWMNWGYCGSPYNAYPMPAGEIKAAIMMTEEIATKFAGAEITAIQVANPTNTNYANPIAGDEVTVWIAESLDGEPIMSGTGEFGPDGFEYTSVNLDQPYSIKAGTPVYIGYSFVIPEQEANGMYSIITDYTLPENSHSAYLYSTYTGFDKNGNMQFSNKYEWRAVGKDFGNFCITATLTGDMLPQNIVSIPEYLIPSVVKPASEFDFVFITVNDGANTVSDIDLTFDMEGQEPQVKRIELDYGPLSYNEYSMDTIQFVCNRTGNNLPYTISVSAVNGNPIDNGQKINGNLLCIEKGFDRNVVVEEATGTWCGWCVVGYAGMEYMKENYSGKGFIGIAMHQGDEMSVLDKNKSYYEFSQYISGFPSAFMDRNWYYSIYPAPEEIEYEFLNMVSNPAYAKIEAELIAEEGAKDVKLITKTMFAESEENANYGIAYTVVEDNVGPYVQTNYTSGSGQDYYGFENEPEAVPLMFNDVARNCSHPQPFDDSLPTKTEANTEYEYSFDVNLKGVTNLDNCRIIPMVIDRTTGYILNACEVRTPSGIDQVNNSDNSIRVFGGKGFISVSNEVSSNIYSADGRIIAKNVNGNVELPAGIYIVNAAGRSFKVVVR